jgi:hypothetical protein
MGRAIIFHAAGTPFPRLYRGDPRELRP